MFICIRLINQILYVHIEYVLIYIFLLALRPVKILCRRKPFHSICSDNYNRLHSNPLYLPGWRHLIKLPIHIFPRSSSWFLSIRKSSHYYHHQDPVHPSYMSCPSYSYVFDKLYIYKIYKYYIFPFVQFFQLCITFRFSFLFFVINCRSMNFSQHFPRKSS